MQFQAFDQRNVVAVAGDQRDGVHARGHHQRVDGQADFPGALRGAAAAAVSTTITAAVVSFRALAAIGVGSNFQFFDLQFVTESRERFVKAGLIDVWLLNDVLRWRGRGDECQ